MTLNLHHLRVFGAVVEHGGFSRAAAALRLSQPAVSKTVQELERQVGLPLLERSGRVPRLTEAGASLFARARELFGVERAAEEELSALRGLERGSLRLGASTTVATYLLAPLLARFQREHPGVRLLVRSANTRSIARLMLEWRIDVAIVEGPVTNDRLDVVPWMEDELVLISPSGHQLAQRAHVGVEELARVPLILRERGSGTRAVASSALAELGVRPPVAMQLGSTEAIKQAVAAGLGLAIVSRSAAADQLALGRIALVPLRGVQLRRTVTELRVRGRAPGAPAAAFRRLLETSRQPALARNPT